MFDDFQDGHHGGHFVYRNRMTSNSESLCRCDASHQFSMQLAIWEMPFEEFQDGRDGGWRISERNDFSNSESPCLSDVSEQVPP